MVTGEVAAHDRDGAGLLTQATTDYSAYVDARIQFLLVPVQELASASAIGTGDLAAAQQAYVRARPFYERIEPVAESFPDLDPAIDQHIGDVEAGAPGGAAVDHLGEDHELRLRTCADPRLLAVTS